MITQPKKVRPSRPAAPGFCPCGAQGYSSPWEGDFLLCMQHALLWLKSPEKIRAMKAIEVKDDEGLLLAIDSFCDRIRVRGYTREVSDALWGFPPREAPPPKHQYDELQLACGVAECVADCPACAADLKHHASGEGKCDCNHAPCRHDAFRFMCERDDLARAIGDACVGAGIIKPGTHLTGPQLLMLCSDLAFTAREAANRPTIVDHIRAICIALGLVKEKK